MQKKDFLHICKMLHVWSRHMFYQVLHILLLDKSLSSSSINIYLLTLSVFSLLEEKTMPFYPW